MQIRTKNTETTKIADITENMQAATHYCLALGNDEAGVQACLAGSGKNEN